MDVLERYWVDTPEAFEQRIREIVDLYPLAIQRFELCRSAGGSEVPGFRIGKGDEHVVLLGRAHGHEPSGTCGLTALIEGIAAGRTPQGEPFAPARPILDRFTLHIFPMLNPSAAARYASRYRHSYIGEIAAQARARGEFERWLHEEYEPVLHEPGITVGRRRPPFFTSEELGAFEKTGRTMGSLFTEDGVELWKDWRNGRAPQTRALEALLRDIRPRLLVDVHNDSPPTRICPPTELAPGDEPRSRGLMERLYQGLARGGLEPAQRRYTPYLKEDPEQSVSWAYTTLGTTQFLYEVDGLGSQESMLLSVWYGIVALLQGILDELDGRGEGRNA